MEAKLKEVQTKEVVDVKNTDMQGIKDIKAETSRSYEERDEYLKNEVFKENDVENSVDEHFNSYEDRIAHTPKENSELGSWEGERGESKFVPNENTDNGQAAIEALKEKGQDGIEYKDAEPDFSKCAEATVEIDNMTESRENYREADGTTREGNFTQADIKCAEKWSLEGKDGKNEWTAREVSNWRHDNNCSWHERCDTKTMDLVSFDIHNHCKHLGGVSECKVRDSVDVGGGFDE